MGRSLPPREKALVEALQVRYLPEPPADRAPLDFWRDENAPVGYLPKA